MQLLSFTKAKVTTDRFPGPIATRFFKRLGKCTTVEQVENCVADALMSADIWLSFMSFRDLSRKLHAEYGREAWVGRLVFLALQAEGKEALVKQKGNAAIASAFAVFVSCLVMIGIISFITGCAFAECPYGDEGDCVGNCCIEEEEE